jgi:hypothetical protein
MNIADSASRAHGRSITQLLATAVLLICGGAWLGYHYLSQQLAMGSYTLTLPDHDWSTSRETLVIAVRYGCHYCEASFPFYSKLWRASRNRPKKDVKIIFISQENEYLAVHAVPGDIAADAVHPNIAFPSWVSGTPTIIAVSQSGRVTHIWRGVLNFREEEELLKRVVSS